MPNKNHLRIIANRQLEESGEVKFNYGFGNNDDEANPEPNYIFMARAFRDDLQSYRSDLEVKAGAKDETINVPYNVDYVEVDFMGQFLSHNALNLIHRANCLKRLCRNLLIHS